MFACLGWDRLYIRTHETVWGCHIFVTCYPFNHGADFENYGHLLEKTGCFYISVTNEITCKLIACFIKCFPSLFLVFNFVSSLRLSYPNRSPVSVCVKEWLCVCVVCVMTP